LTIQKDSIGQVERLSYTDIAIFAPRFSKCLAFFKQCRSESRATIVS